MSDLKNYIIVGVITGIILYYAGLDMFSNKIQIIEANDIQKTSASSSYSSTVEKVNQSVVSIYTKKTYENNIFFIDPRERRLKRRETIPSGQGSGVVVSSNGYIITNFHVIQGSNEILVRDSNGNDHQTSVIGYDFITDLAVIKINGNLKPITFGKIENVRVGDISLAIGNPLGVGQTITLGIVSATDKEISPEAYSYQRYVQTDAAINPGNSGGALVNSNGELIGINTMISTLGGGSDGIGFAIPVDIVKYVFTQIIENGEVIRGFVGIISNPNYRGDGVMISGFYDDGPGQRANMRAGDIIKKVNDEKVNKIKDMQDIIGKSKPGDLVSFQIQRNSDIININVEVEKMPKL